MHLKVFIVVAQGKRREGEEEGLKIITWDLRAAGPALSHFQRWFGQLLPPNLMIATCSLFWLELHSSLPLLLSLAIKMIRNGLFQSLKPCFLYPTFNQNVCWWCKSLFSCRAFWSSICFIVSFLLSGLISNRKMVCLKIRTRLCMAWKRNQWKVKVIALLYFPLLALPKLMGSNFTFAFSPWCSRCLPGSPRK